MITSLWKVAAASKGHNDFEVDLVLTESSVMRLMVMLKAMCDATLICQEISTRDVILLMKYFLNQF